MEIVVDFRLNNRFQFSLQASAVLVSLIVNFVNSDSRRCSVVKEIEFRCVTSSH